MKLKFVAAAAALALSGGAFAAHDLGELSAAPDSFLFAAGPGLFSSGYLFSLGSLSDVSGIATMFPIGMVSEIGVTVSNGMASYTDTNAKDGFTFAGLGAGDYTLNVFGYSSVATSAVGFIAAAPVPEPETYAMMLAGLVAVGFLASRRKNG
ncbi:MAG: FxDxF family PEP-CTERM protein [Pseudomonadota bacterium]